MKPKDLLLRLIKEEVAVVLDEAEKTKKEQPPKSFSEFRQRVGAALKQAGADESLVDEVNDVSYEGGGVASALFNAWNVIEDELALNGDDDWQVAIEGHLHDAILDVMSEYSNSMNYEPGSKRGKAVSASELANKVVDAFSPSRSPSSSESKDRHVIDMSMLVSDILDAAVKAGAIHDVEWDRGKTEIPYLVQRSDYLEIIDTIATKEAGLTPSSEEIDGAYVDDITGLTVTFGDGVATIKEEIARTNANRRFLNEAREHVLSYTSNDSEAEALAKHMNAIFPNSHVNKGRKVIVLQSPQNTNGKAALTHLEFYLRLKRPSWSMQFVGSTLKVTTSKNRTYDLTWTNGLHVNDVYAGDLRGALRLLK